MCSGIVGFVKKRDRYSRFEFVPQQSERGKELMKLAGVDAGNTDTVVLLINSQYYFRSDAALKVFRLMGGGWQLLYGFIIVPRFIRDYIYNLIASNRFRLFGRRDTCYLP
jgi:predicted DCC family thiol-disulfide oxidoreductase YuxK